MHGHALQRTIDSGKGRPTWLAVCSVCMSKIAMRHTCGSEQSIGLLSLKELSAKLAASCLFSTSPYEGHGSTVTTSSVLLLSSRARSSRCSATPPVDTRCRHVYLHVKHVRSTLIATVGQMRQSKTLLQMRKWVNAEPDICNPQIVTTQNCMASLAGSAETNVTHQET